MITLRNLHKNLGGKPVLRGLQFDVLDGQSIALLGLSGSGKTTVLKCLCGLLVAEVGTIHFDSLHVRPDAYVELRKRLGYVVQEGGLFPHMTLLENLALVGRESGLSADAIKARTHELAALVKLSVELLQRYPGEVSGGQRQRVGLMRALFLDPSYLLLDEPLGALDPITRRELQDELKELFQRLGKTVVLVTHDLAEARRLCQRIILLDDGVISQEGTMDDLIHRPANDFVRRFVQAQDVT